ncbi:MAG: bifunctional UDP-sugar hydrolase/5'-nucleotidase [Candidatus Freyarchaeota archaeon]
MKFPKITALIILLVFAFGIVIPAISPSSNNIGSENMMLFFATSSNYGLSKQDTIVNLTILHTGDIHSQLLPWPYAQYRPGTNNDETRGGIARLATLVNQTRTQKAAVGEAVLLFDAGDFLMGTPFQYLGPNSTLNCSPELHMMNLIGFNASCLGNHEWEYSVHGLSLILNNTNSTLGGSMPLLLCSNLVLGNDSYGLGQFIKNNETLTVTTNGETLKIGLFSLMGKNAMNAVFFKGNYTFLDPIQTAREQVTYFQNKGVDLIILISHMGYKDAQLLASSVPGIDLIIAAHDHLLLEQTIVVVTSVGNTTIVDAKSYLEYLGKLELNVKKGGHSGQAIVGFHYQAIPINDTIPENETILNELNPYIDAVNSLLSEWDLPPINSVIAHVNFNLTYSTPGFEKPTGESPVGDLVADAIRWAASNVTGKYLDFAFVPSGTIKHGKYFCLNGNITVYDANSIIPFGGIPYRGPYRGWPICTFHLYGYEIKRILEFSVLAGGDFFIQISGLRFTYALIGIPTMLVVSIEQEINGTWTPLEMNKLYRSAISYEAAILIPQIGHLYPMFCITPKNESGNPIPSNETAIYDDEGRPFPLHLGLIRFLTDYLGGEVPEIYNQSQNRAKAVLISPTLALFLLNQVGQALNSQSTTSHLLIGGVAGLILIAIVAVGVILSRRP